jgi:hypothetical protein
VSGSSATGEADGGSGIGHGYASSDSDSTIGNLRLSGNLTIFCDSLGASSVLIENASVLIFTPGSRLFSVTPYFSGSASLTVLYGTGTGERQEMSLSGLPGLYIGNISLPVDYGWNFCVLGLEAEGVCFQDVYPRVIRGLFTSVPGEGSYSIVADGPVSGLLVPSADERVFQVSSTGSFFPQAYFIIPSSRTRSQSAAQTPLPSPTSSLCFTRAANHIRKRSLILETVGIAVLMWDYRH